MPGWAEPCGAEAVEHGYCELHKPLAPSGLVLLTTEDLIAALERGIAAVPELMRRNPDNGFDQTSAAMRRLIDALKDGETPRMCVGYEGQGEWSVAIDICRAHGIDPWAEWPAPLTPQRFSAAAVEIGAAAFRRTLSGSRTPRASESDWTDAANFILKPPPGREMPGANDPEIHRQFRERGVDFAILRLEAIQRGYDVLDPLPETPPKFEAMRAAVKS